MKHALLAAGLLLIPRAALAQDPLTAYPCHNPTSPPTIDGEVRGDPAWQTIPSVTGFRVLGGGYAEAKQTSAQACWDERAIYVAMVCEEPDAAELAPAMADGGWTWGEDSVEIFLQRTPAAQVYQFGVTPGGAKGSGEGSPDISLCRAGATIGSDFYSIELRIPFEVISATPAAGDEWRATFCRNIFVTTSGGDKFTTWAPLKSRFLEPENYLPIVFRASALDASEATALTARLSSEYRPVLVARLRATAGLAAEYVAALEAPARDAEFGREARALLREWRRIERLSKGVESAPLPEIRRAIATARSIATASYQLKYNYLLTELVSEE